MKRKKLWTTKKKSLPHFDRSENYETVIIIKIILLQVVTVKPQCSQLLGKYNSAIYMAQWSIPIIYFVCYSHQSRHQIIIWWQLAKWTCTY